MDTVKGLSYTYGSKFLIDFYLLATPYTYTQGNDDERQGRDNRPNLCRQSPAPYTARGG